MPFDLSHVFGGLQKGLDYDAKVKAILVWAWKTNNQAALTDAMAVVEQNVKEFAATAASGGTMVLFSGGDPFQNSRRMAQALAAKYPGH